MVRLNQIGITEITVKHPFNGKNYMLFHYNNSGCDVKPKVKLSFCKQLNAFGVKAWFSDRIWFINNKVEVLL